MVEVGDVFAPIDGVTQMIRIRIKIKMNKIRILADRNRK
jgi:translation initiation factor IF-1